MEGLPRQEEAGREGGSPASLDEFQVALLTGWAIKLVPHDAVPAVRQVYADLMHTAGDWLCPDDCEGHSRLAEAALHPKFRHGRCTRRVDALFHPDARVADSALAKKRAIHPPGVQRRVTVDEGEVFLFDFPPLHEQRQAACGILVLGRERESARFSVEPVDDADLTAIRDFVGEKTSQFVPEGGSHPRLAGVGLQKGRLVHHQEIVVLKNHSRRIRR